MDKTLKLNIWYVLAAILAISLFQAWINAAQQVQQLAYSEFLDLLKQGQIEEVVVKESGLEGRLKTARDGKILFATRRVDPEFAEELARYGVKITGATEKTVLGQLLSWLVPIAFFFALWMLVFRRFAERQGFGGLTNVGKSKAKVYVETATGVTFEDVAGVDEAKAELQEIVAFLRDKETYGRLGAHIPKGILLVGPPGTGKTLLARAVAGEAGVPFFSISGSEFVEMFVGVGAARVRDLFEQAGKAAPCIIFIDELDALGRARGLSGLGGGHDEKEQTLNQLLAELDGFDPREGIVLLAATNRPEILDPALMRSGRFDRQVVVDRPDKAGREAILRVHMRKIKFADDADSEKIAALTPGLTGADLANLVNEAAIVATRRQGDMVTLDDFTSAVERIVAGTEKRGRVLNDHERRVVAYHEMGHALAAAATPGSDPVHKVSIIPRSIGALGYTMQRPTEDRFLITAEELQNRMVVLMAGRAAEDLAFGEFSTGAADDLDKATDVARQMVTRFGMVPELGQMVYDPQRQRYLDETTIGLTPQNYSPQTAREIDVAIRRLIDVAYERAKAVLAENRADLDAGAELLLQRETITPDDFPPLRSVDRVD